MTPTDRRTFLTASAAGLAALPLALRRALAVPAAKVSGTIQDVQHVVILMQENRSFDHYFGSLPGVRGFGDPRALILPSGHSVFRQPRDLGSDEAVTPFRLNTGTTSAQFMKSLDHSWKGSQARWKHHDAWIPAKTDLAMGYFTRQDIPFYYALADAFTICDAYHCSIFGPTSPNRMFLFSGTNGLTVGEDGPDAVINTPVEVNETADPRNDASAFASYKWMTYAQRLGTAGIDWKLYQEFDNYGDNELAYFASFRGIDPSSDLHKRGRAWVDGSDAGNAKQSRGEHLIAAFAKDVAEDRLPQVSYIVAPYIVCEHPAAPPGYGESFTSGMIAALAANPEVWAKTVFILTYDENDGFFDHVPPLVPPYGPGTGASNIATDGEYYHGDPVGFGPRVPTIVVSPWTRGGWVNSQLFDHTSIIRFLEARFGVHEPQISPWRRAMAGDLTSVFDFASPGSSALVPDGRDRLAATDASHALPPPQAIPEGGHQEKGQRPARALPYDFDMTGVVQDGEFQLEFINRSPVGAGIMVYHNRDVRCFTAAAGTSLSDQFPMKGAVIAHGPNGFLREYRGAVPLEIRAMPDRTTGELILAIRNRGAVDLVFTSRANAHVEGVHRHKLAPGATIEDRWPLFHSDNWYDVSVMARGGFACRLAGHMEDGKPSRSDPAMA